MKLRFIISSAHGWQQCPEIMTASTPISFEERSYPLCMCRVGIVAEKTVGARVGLRNTTEPQQSIDGDHFPFLRECSIRECCGMLLAQQKRRGRVARHRLLSAFQERKFSALRLGNSR